MQLLRNIPKTKRMNLKDLEDRVKALESGKEYDATKQAVQKVETDCLLKLRSIRQAMASGGDGSGGSSAGAASSKEMEALKTENEKLKKHNAKLQYRVQHLMSSVETLLSERSKAGDSN